jgi:hypothetical protein
MRSDGNRARVDWLLAGARLLVACWLAWGALVFLRHGRGAFAHLGRPDSARVAIALAEIVGAALFLFGRTALAGGLALSLLLAFVAGLHFAAGGEARMLPVFLFAVLALTAATRAQRAGERT